MNGTITLLISWEFFQKLPKNKKSYGFVHFFGYFKVLRNPEFIRKFLYLYLNVFICFHTFTSKIIKMLMLMFLINLLIISITKSKGSCDISTNSKIPFTNKNYIIGSLQSCLGNLKNCQNGIETKGTNKPMFIS